MFNTHNSSNAYKYQHQEYYIPSQQPDEHQRPKKKAEPARHANKLNTILGVLVCFAVLFFIMLRYAAITEASNTIARYKHELNQIKTANEQVEVELNRSIDLRKVEEIAKNKLGMQTPEKHQIIMVELERNDYSEIPDIRPENDNQQGVLVFIHKTITNVLEYLY